MKTKAELVAWCESKLGTPYVYGAKGAVLTQSQIDNWAALYPSTFTESYITKAKAFIGQRCIDCSGLISWLTGTIRNSTNYKATAVQILAISRLDESMIGWALWKQDHIGVYIGNGYCIEAKGIDSGTVKTKVSASTWTHVLKLCDIDYTEETIIEEEKKSGWVEENGGWRFYLGDTGEYVQNDWYRDGDDWYWFDGNGMMVADNWRIGPNGKWYYMADSGAMVKNKWAVWNDELYRLTEDGSMYEGRLNLKSDEKGALQLFNDGTNELGYVKDGMILCLDGIRNTRYGHDEAVTYWHDLSGNESDPVLLSGNGMSFGETYCHMEGGYWRIDAPEYGLSPMTFEIVCQTDEDFMAVEGTVARYLPGIAGNYDNRMFRFAVTPDGEYAKVINGSGSPVSLSIDQTKKIVFSVVSSSITLSNIGTNTSNVKTYVNGGAVGDKSLGSSYVYKDSPIHLGKTTITNSAYPWFGKIYSVRIYNRELSQEELEYNYSIDRVRFNF